MIASKCLYNGVDGIYSHSFDAVMSRELNLSYNKDVQSTINKVRLTTKRNIDYSFDDVDRLLELEAALFQKLLNEDAHENYLFQCEFVKAQAYMENCGLQISSSLWRQKSENDILNLKKAQEKIKEYIYDNLPKFRVLQLDLFGDNKKIICNLDSPKQMIPVFKELGINTWDEREEKDSISEGIINKSKHEFVDMWLNYQGHNHNVSTFGLNLLDKIHNERIYSNFNILAETGRMLSRKGSINFLNFPSNKETRSCFKSAKGWKSIGCDYDSQEAKILAWESQDENAKLNVIHGRDTHSLLARQIFEELKDLSDKEIKTQHNDKRQLGKIAGFCFGFGGSGFTAAVQLNVSLELGNKMYEAYRTLYKDVFTWGERNFQEAIKVGYLVGTHGFRRYFSQFDVYKSLETEITTIDWDQYKIGKQEWKKIKQSKEDDTQIIKYKSKYPKESSYYSSKVKIVSKFFSMKSGYFNMVLNWPIQSCASFMTKKAVSEVFKRIKENNHLEVVKISNFIYDEILLDAPEELAEQYRLILQDEMRKSGNFYVNNDAEIKITCDANVADDWYSTK
jgi:DNA polymerase I-like protein with 3'-5' exonuclease and polymerase domains